jgi:DNA anti-recombination protein RmuC
MNNAEESKGTTGALPADGAAGGENVDRIREILFGSQQREMEKKMARLEERLSAEATGLRDESKKRFDSLNLYLKNEMESLTERIKAEQDERVEKLSQISRELKELAKAMEKRITQLDEQGSKHQRDLRKQILDQGEELSAEFRRLHQELKAVVEVSTQELRAEKPSRSALANLFTEMALRLNNEFNIPGADAPTGKAARAGAK